MTNLEIIKHLIGDNADIQDSRIQTTCQVFGFNSSDTYNANDQTNKCQVYKVAIVEIQRFSGKVKRESEGGYSKEYIDNSNSVLKSLARESGCQELIDMLDDTPEIRNASKFW